MYYKWEYCLVLKYREMRAYLAFSYRDKSTSISTFTTQTLVKVRALGNPFMGRGLKIL